MENLARIVASVLFFSSVSTATVNANESNLTAVSMCSGGTIYIDFGLTKDPSDAPQHQMTACHAICDNRDDMDDSEDV